MLSAKDGCHLHGGMDARGRRGAEKEMGGEMEEEGPGEAERVLSGQESGT